MRYAVVYQKGGVGKTTIAVHLATRFAQSGPTLLIDGDPQESSATWAGWRREHRNLKSPTTVRLRGKAVYDEGLALSTNFQNTVIDAGGRDGAGLRNALLLAERLIIPIGNSGMDAAPLDEFMDRVEEARAFNRSLEVMVLLSRIDSRSQDEELRAFVEERGLPLFSTNIGERAVYRHSTGEGLTVNEYKPKIAAATYETSKFYEEVENWS
jgi:chromosome partitioning protein